MSHLLEVKNLMTQFPTRAGLVRAVDGVSFHVDEGELLGLVGESGCGKSITALSVMRLVGAPGRIAGGEILFAGENLLAASEERLRAIRGDDIAMIFQDPMTSLNPVYTVGEQIAEALRLHRQMNRKQAREAAVEAMREVSIPDPGRRADDYPHQLSGGMRQRVMIAMALACDPRLLIADEPTTALDVTIQAQILELLNRLQEELGMAIILITHDLGVVAETCDRVIVMYAGQVFEEGPVDDVFRNPQNPYTEGLLLSIPRLGTKTNRLAVIPGVVPSPLDWPTGCRFHARCPYGWEKTEREEPPLFELAPGRRSKCWLVEYPERREEVRAKTGGFTPEGALTGTGAATSIAGEPAGGLTEPASPSGSAADEVAG